MLPVRFALHFLFFCPCCEWMPGPFWGTHWILVVPMLQMDAWSLSGTQWWFLPLPTLQVDAYFFHGNSVDDTMHGTHVASTLAGSAWNPRSNQPFDPLQNPDYATGTPLLPLLKLLLYSRKLVCTAEGAISQLAPTLHPLPAVGSAGSKAPPCVLPCHSLRHSLLGLPEQGLRQRPACPFLTLSPVKMRPTASWTCLLALKCFMPCTNRCVFQPVLYSFRVEPMLAQCPWMASNTEAQNVSGMCES